MIEACIGCAFGLSNLVLQLCGAQVCMPGLMLSVCPIHGKLETLFPTYTNLCILTVCKIKICKNAFVQLFGLQLRQQASRIHTIAFSPFPCHQKFTILA